MALDLSLLVPMKGRPWHLSRGEHFASTELLLDCNYRLFSHIKDIGRCPDVAPVCSPKLVPESVRVYRYMDHGLKTIRTDAYGDPLTYVRVEELLRIPDKAFGMSRWNRAVWALLKGLDPELEIVLYWC